MGTSSEKQSKLPVGIENFEEIRRAGFYYVDKTTMIRDLLLDWGKVNLFTRPRRFGKTLNMSMLKSFFEIGCDARIFDGLAIAEEKELCAAYMGKFPVIFISLKSVDGMNFHQALERMISVVQEEAVRLYDSLREKKYKKRLNKREKMCYTTQVSGKGV